MEKLALSPNTCKRGLPERSGFWHPRLPDVTVHDVVVSLKPLERASASLRRALTQPKDEFLRDSVIQRFEYTYELAWKCLRRYFEQNQRLTESNVKNLWREAGKQGLIDDVERWFGYHEARNRTSHTYDEAVAEQIYEAARAFADDVEVLIDRLRPLVG